MDAHAKNDEEVFLLHAGVSIERLAKAVLGKQNAFFLMEMKGNEDALFQFAGVEQPTRIRTIGAAQAIKRLKRLGILSQAPDPDLDELIELRNGVAHLVPTNAQYFDGLTVFVRTTAVLLSALPHHSARWYWGPHHPTVKVTMDEATERATRLVRQAVEQARYRLRERIRLLPSAMEAEFKESRSIRTPEVDTNARSVLLPHKCPACRYYGALVTGPPVLIKRDKPGEAVPRLFACRVCGLRLGTPELLTAAGLNKRVPLVDLRGERVMTPAEEFLWFESPAGEEDD